MAAEMRLEEAHEMQVAAHAKVLWWPEEVLTAQLMSFGKWHLREVYWMFVICEVAWLNPWQTAVFAKKDVFPPVMIPPPPICACSSLAQQQSKRVLPNDCWSNVIPPTQHCRCVAMCKE
eukprot:scaffold97235_cov19-Tisochrysis_lutea.AAC.1